MLTVESICEHVPCRYGERRTGMGNQGLHIFDISENLKTLQDGHLFKYLGMHTLAALLYKEVKGTGLLESGRMNLLQCAGRTEKEKRTARREARTDTSFEKITATPGGFRRVFVNPDRDPDNGALVLGGACVECFVMVHPVAPSALAECSAVALDASFKALRPCGCYFVPQAIIKNTAVPIGLIVAASEASRALQFFKEALDEASKQWGSVVDWTRIRILGDMGKGLARFCRMNSLPLFICWFHIIRWFGATVVSGAIMREIFRIASDEEWLEIRDVLVVHIIGLRDDGNLANADRILEFIRYIFDGTWGEFEQAPWRRFGVPLCNNHVEGSHRWFNTVDLQLPLANRLEWMIDRIDERVKEIGDGVHQAAAKRSMFRTTDAKAELEFCDCAIARRNAELWGVTRGACPHVRPFTLEFEPMPKLERFGDLGWERIEDKKPWKAHARVRQTTEKIDVPEFEFFDDDLHDRLKRLARNLCAIDAERYRGFTSPNRVFLAPRAGRKLSEDSIASQQRMFLTKDGIDFIKDKSDELAFRAFCRRMIALACGEGLNSLLRPAPAGAA
jgi:hypothetical protein